MSHLKSNIRLTLKKKKIKEKEGEEQRGEGKGRGREERWGRTDTLIMKVTNHRELLDCRLQKVTPLGQIETPSLSKSEHLRLFSISLCLRGLQPELKPFYGLTMHLPPAAFIGWDHDPLTPLSIGLRDKVGNWETSIDNEDSMRSGEFDPCGGMSGFYEEEETDLAQSCRWRPSLS